MFSYNTRQDNRNVYSTILGSSKCVSGMEQGRDVKGSLIDHMPVCLAKGRINNSEEKVTKT